MLKRRMGYFFVFGLLLMAMLMTGNGMTVVAAQNTSLTIGEGSVATGEYAEWKNTAITYPAKGQLVAAGRTAVEFVGLDNAVKYEVYMDDELIRTIEGSAVNAESFEAEYRSVDVAKHTTYVVATLPNGGTVTSNIRSFYISKKGLGIWQSDSDMIEEMNCSWYYNWSPYELTGVDEKIQFVPMIWGADEDPRAEHAWSRSQEWAWLRVGNYEEYRNLLSFNEPDLAGQAEVTPARAVELWEEFEAISDEGIIVGSPAVAVPMSYYTSTDNEYGAVGGWFGKFEQLLAEEDYHYDVTAVHIYLDWPSEQVLEILENTYKMTGKPIWITEWGIAGARDFNWAGGADGSWQRDYVEQFLEDFLPVIDKLDYVERYAWFPFDGSDEINGAGGLFFAEGVEGEEDRFTGVGDLYKTLGNPEGWDPDVVPEDQVVIDPVVEEPEEDTPKSVPATKVTVNKTTLSMDKGKTYTLKATMAPSNTTDTVAWSSSDSSVAKVSAKGVVTAVKKGTATITAKTTGGKTAVCKVTVKVPATKVKLNKKVLSINKGNTYTLKATITPADSTDKVTWSSSDPKVAKVSAKGVVKALRKGTVTITAKTSGGKKATCKVTVKVPATKVKLNKETISLKVGKTCTLKATMTPRSSTDKLKWSSSNKKVAKVSAKGVVTAVKKGKATITVKTTSGKKATCKVTVK